MEGSKLKTTLSKKPTGVFYVDGNRAFYYEQSISSPLSTAIPPEAVSDLEVIDKKKLDVAIQAFLSTHKLPPKNIIILLSTQVTFDRDFTQSSVDVMKNIDEFLELVPFESILSKKSVFSGRTKVVAANKELCESIKVGFQKSGFIVQGVYPLSLLLEIMPSLQSNLDLAMVIGKVPDMKNFNLIPAYDMPVNVQKEEKQSKSRLFVLAGLFGLLLILLVFFVYKNLIAPSREVKRLPAPKLKPIAPIITPIPVSTESAQTNSLDVATPSAITPTITN